MNMAACPAELLLRHFPEYTLCEIVCEIWFWQKMPKTMKQETYIIRPNKYLHVIV